MERRFLRGSVFAAILIFFAVAPTYSQQASSSPSSKLPTSQYIQDLLAERMRNNGVGIVVGIIDQNGTRIVTQGKSGSPNNSPLDGDTIFQIGSVTKVLTGLLLADMIQRGEVRLNDPISNYLPANVRMIERGRPITLLDLMVHQSGLPSMPTNFDLKGKPNPVAAYSEEQLYEFLSTFAPVDEPGTKAAYSNVGVALLGRLLARRVGKSYEALLKERILLPLGMNDTTITLTPDQKRRLAPGHDRFLQSVESWEMVTLPASGSLRSTANDMLKLLSAYLGYTDTPLSAAMEYQRATRQPVGSSRALGLGIRRANGEEQFGHDGGKEGYRSGIVFSPARRTGVVVLANARTDDVPINIAFHIDSGRRLDPAPYAPARPVKASVSRKKLNGYTGRYRLSPTEIWIVERRDAGLLVDSLGDGISTYAPASDTQFHSNTEARAIEFSIDPDGRARGFTLKEESKERWAEKL